MKYSTCLIMLSVWMLGCNQQQKKPGSADKLKIRKASVDSMITEKSVRIFVKVAGQKELQEVRDKKYPPGVETTYNMVKDKAGKIVYIAELPFSGESDWFIAYRNYFDEDGKLFAFQKLNNFLHSECTRGAAIEKSTSYYSPSFKLLDSAYTLTDTQNKPLEKASCKFPYNFPYKIFKDSEAYIKERGLH